MNEAKLTTKFAHWVSRNHETLPPFVFEAKIVKLDEKKSCGLCDFQPHQLPNLRKATGTGLYWKIPDLGSQNPCDGFYFKGEAFVIIFWYLPRKIKTCTVIRIQDFDKFIEEAGKKSIRMEEAEEIAVYCFDL